MRVLNVPSWILMPKTKMAKQQLLRQIIEGRTDIVSETWQGHCEYTQQYGDITLIQECCHYYVKYDVDGVNELLGETVWTLMSRHRWSRSPYNVDLQ